MSAKITFVCANCGIVFTKERRKCTRNRRFCCRKCAGLWQSKHRKGDSPFKVKTPDEPRPPRYDVVDIRVTEPLDVFPEYRPTVGRRYRAERYQGYAGLKRIGYVIEVNGHRVNVRQEECVEV